MRHHTNCKNTIKIIQRDTKGSTDGAVVRALASHQCVPSIPGPGVICELSFIVVGSLLCSGTPGTPVFPSPQEPTFPKFQFDPGMHGHL